MPVPYILLPRCGDSLPNIGAAVCSSQKKTRGYREGKKKAKKQKERNSPLE